MKEIKTNAMRILDFNKVEYEALSIDLKEAVDGVTCANLLHEDVDSTFKTLVVVGKSGEHYVFVIPVKEKLDLKKAAILANEKSLTMLPQTDLLGLTGYVHGGCSPIGMKKEFKTFFHETIIILEKIIFSGGKVGYFVKLKTEDLNKVLNYEIGDIIV